MQKKAATHTHTEQNTRKNGRVGVGGHVAWVGAWVWVCVCVCGGLSAAFCKKTFLSFCFSSFFHKFEKVFPVCFAKTQGGVLCLLSIKNRKLKAKKSKIESLEPHAHTPARAHTPHTPKTRPTPRCANARAHGHARTCAHTHPLRKNPKVSNLLLRSAQKGPKRQKHNLRTRIEM